MAIGGPISQNVRVRSTMMNLETLEAQTKINGFDQGGRGIFLSASTFRVYLRESAMVTAPSHLRSHRICILERYGTCGHVEQRANLGTSACTQQMEN